jgi:hypothetical protein
MDLAFDAIFRAAPPPLLVLAVDSPRFTILAANDAYLAATMTTTDDLVGRALFDAFPDNPSEPAATGTRNLHASLERVLATKPCDVMPVQRYDILRRRSVVREFEERYWAPRNVRVLDSAGSLRYLVHSVEDVTAAVLAELRTNAAAGLLSAREGADRVSEQAQEEEPLRASVRVADASFLQVHVLVKDGFGNPLDDHVLPLHETVRWLNENCGGLARCAEVYRRDGVLLLTLSRDDLRPWGLRRDAPAFD